ncbi:MAG: hypothetical protein ABH864_03840 [archaeon]
MKEVKTGLLVLLLFVALFFLASNTVQADPVGPDSVVFESNTTKNTTSTYMLNVSGGRVVIFNMTSDSQNNHWKAFIGRVSGSFTLDDAGGSTVYDWSLGSIGGEVYATRNSSTINWNNLSCATISNMESENAKMSHTSPQDNITATFDDTTHDEFFVATVNISLDSCSTLNTYVANATQDTSFEEVALYEYTGGNMVYATILEENAYGYDNRTYDFQMIVPEVASPGWSGATAYYLYVEIS